MDLVLTDLSAKTTTFACLGTSDHNSVSVKMDVPVYRDKAYRRKVLSYEKANFWTGGVIFHLLIGPLCLRKVILRKNAPMLPMSSAKP